MKMRPISPMGQEGARACAFTLNGLVVNTPGSGSFLKGCVEGNSNLVVCVVSGVAA